MCVVIPLRPLVSTNSLCGADRCCSCLCLPDLTCPLYDMREACSYRTIHPPDPPRKHRKCSHREFQVKSINLHKLRKVNDGFCSSFCHDRNWRSSSRHWFVILLDASLFQNPVFPVNYMCSVTAPLSYPAIKLKISFHMGSTRWSSVTCQTAEILDFILRQSFQIPRLSHKSTVFDLNISIWWSFILFRVKNCVSKMKDVPFFISINYEKGLLDRLSDATGRFLLSTWKFDCRNYDFIKDDAFLLIKQLTDV